MVGNQPHTGDITEFAPFSISRDIDTFVGEHAFGSELVIFPNLLIQMQSRAPLAKKEVVDVTNWD